MCDVTAISWQQLRLTHRKLSNIHYNGVTWASWRPNSPTNRLCVQQLVQPCKKEVPNFRISVSLTLRWRHNDHASVSNHQPHGCLLNRLFRNRSKKTSKLRVTGLCAGNSPGPVNSPHKGPVTRKICPFDDVIMRGEPRLPSERPEMRKAFPCHDVIMSSFFSAVLLTKFTQHDGIYMAIINTSLDIIPANSWWGLLNI